MMPPMDTDEVRAWFRSYLADFVVLGRGDLDDVRQILEHYGVPMLISTDAGTTALTDEDQVLALARQQVDGMRAAGHDRSEELAGETTVLGRHVRHPPRAVRARSRRRLRDLAGRGDLPDHRSSRGPADLGDHRALGGVVRGADQDSLTSYTSSGGTASSRSAISCLSTARWASSAAERSGARESAMNSSVTKPSRIWSVTVRPR